MLLQVDCLTVTDDNADCLCQKYGLWSSRQVSEAVRIGRRGGAVGVLSSMTEYNRFHIPRLQVEDETGTQEREQELMKDRDQLAREQEKEQELWEQRRTNDRDKERRRMAKFAPFGSTDIRQRKKKMGEDAPGSTAKKRSRKYELIVADWEAVQGNKEEQRRELQGY